MEEVKQEKLLKYGKSKKGNFQVIDTIAVPHPYCLTPKHVVEAADNFGGIMGEAAMQSADDKGIYCYSCRTNNRRHGDPILKYKQHELALLVACYENMEEVKFKKEVQHYLKSIAKMVEEDKYAGFTFLKKF